jgi:curved DNA-binding protein CbpA
VVDMTDQVGDPYAVLRVPSTASAVEVRDAYLRLAKQSHPDRHPDADATARMQRINQAWEILSDPRERASHDARVAAAQAPARPHWGSARRSTAPAYGAEPMWSGPRPRYATEVSQDDAFGPRRWGLLVLAVPAFVLLAALLGPLVPLPIIGLLILFLARALSRPGG